MELLSKELNKRFCKDYSIPINLFEEPYFSDRLLLCDNMYDSINKYVRFINTIKECIQINKDYFELYKTIKERMMEDIKKSIGYNNFLNEDMNKFKCQNKIINSELYNNNNVGQVFISIDMKMANFNALKQYDDNIFYCSQTWVDFVRIYTHDLYFANSKYIRQVTLGNCNPGRQQTYIAYLLDQVVSKLLLINTIKDNILKVSSDEIILKDVSEEDLVLLKEIIKSFKFPLEITRFRLSKIIEGTEDNILGYYKQNMDKQVFWFKNKIKCVSDLYMPAVLRFINGESPQENDLYFKYEHRLSKLIDPLKIRIIV